MYRAASIRRLRPQVRRCIISTSASSGRQRSTVWCSRHGRFMKTSSVPTRSFAATLSSAFHLPLSSDGIERGGRTGLSCPAIPLFRSAHPDNDALCSPPRCCGILSLPRDDHHNSHIERVFCGWACPLGTLHNIVGYFKKGLSDSPG